MRQGDIQIVPKKRFEKESVNWTENIHWRVSRQLWWPRRWTPCDAEGNGYFYAPPREEDARKQATEASVLRRHH